MEKSKLIEQIMTEVKDPELRDRLLRTITENEGTSQGKDQSAISKELTLLGFNPDKVRETVSLGASVTLYSNAIGATVFFILALALFINEMAGDRPSKMNYMAGLFVAMSFCGTYIWINVKAIRAKRLPTNKPTKTSSVDPLSYK